MKICFKLRACVCIKDFSPKKKGDESSPTSTSLRVVVCSKLCSVTDFCKVLQNVPQASVKSQTEDKVEAGCISGLAGS